MDLTCRTGSSPLIVFDKYKKKHRPNFDYFFFYSLVSFCCGVLIFASPFWISSLSSSVNVFLFVTLPQISSVLLSYKCVFIVGNLIVFLLVFGDSKMYSSSGSSSTILLSSPYVCCDEYVHRSSRLLNPSDGEKEEEEIKEKDYLKEEKERTENILEAEELSKRAADFIARVNQQRRLEDTLLVLCCDQDDKKLIKKKGWRRTSAT